MDPLLAVIVAGVLQGVLEWLPVSSSGQSVLLLSAAGLPKPYVASLAIHLGTGFAALARYRRLFVKGVRRPFGVEGLALIVPLAVGAPVALLFQRLAGYAESMGYLMLLVGVLLIVTGVVLHLTRGQHSLGHKQTPSVLDLAVVGVLQGVAVLPGLSRSAIVTGYLALRLGDPLTAIAYTFYTGVTAQLAAGLYGLAVSEFNPLLMAAVGAAFASGYVGIVAVESIALAVKRILPSFLIVYGSIVVLLNIVYPG